MISDSLVRDSPKQQSDQIKGPPPPVPKKPKNPFSKDVAHAIDKPRPYSELLQKNIKMGRRESAFLTEDLDKSSLDLDMAFCPGTLDLSSHMYSGFVPESQPVSVHAVCFNLEHEEKNLWRNLVDIVPETESMDISQINHMLEKKAKRKGPPPPVPKKPPNPFVTIESHVALPNNVSTSEDETSVLTYKHCDYKPYVQEQEVKTRFPTDNFLNIYSNSNTLDELFFLRHRPDLIGQTINVHEKSVEDSRRAAAGKRCNYVLKMSETSDVKKPFSHQTERKLSPKKGESIL